MNQWTKKSLEIAQLNYLERLHGIYNIGKPEKRVLKEKHVNRARVAYEGRNKLELLKALIKFEKFPGDYPYVAFFRANPEWLNSNPKIGTVVSTGYSFTGYTQYR